MTALALHLPSPLQPIMSAGPEAQSREDRQIRQAAENVWHHWEHRGEICRRALDDADDFSYRSVPLETAFRVRVKYRLVGELAPLPYPLDE